ncbi:MAG: hypothetical protein RSE02_02760, partial [Bacteroidales bacterium]
MNILLVINAKLPVVAYGGTERVMWYLGKAAWRVKNVKGAIDIIKLIPGAHLNVIGGTRFNFKMGIRLTFTQKVSFKGMIGGEQKL